MVDDFQIVRQEVNSRWGAVKSQWLPGMWLRAEWDDLKGSWAAGGQGGDSGETGSVSPQGVAQACNGPLL